MEEANKENRTPADDRSAVDLTDGSDWTDSHAIERAIANSLKDQVGTVLRCVISVKSKEFLIMFSFVYSYFDVYTFGQSLKDQQACSVSFC